MALAGHDTIVAVFNDTSTATSYSGTVTGVTTGDLVVVTIHCDGNGNAQTPSGYTVTLGSDTLTHRAGNTTSVVEGFTAIYSGVATATGNPTLTVTTTNSLRAMAANAFLITGYDSTTPHPNSGQNLPASAQTSLTLPNGVTTAADGNAIIGAISIHGGDITNLAVSGADGSSTGETGSNGFNDCEWGVAYKRTPTAASVTFAWTWTTSDRPGATWVEVAEAAASGTTVTPDSLSYTETLNAITIAVDTPVALDTLAYTETLNALTVAVDTPVALDALAYTETLQDLTITATSTTAVDFDTITYTETLNDIGVAVDTPVAFDALAYSEALQDIGIAVDTPVALDALTYTEALNDVGVLANVGVNLDPLQYQTALPDITVATPSVVVHRGDDGGERERFWRKKSEEWLEDYLERLPRVAQKPAAARRRAARRMGEQAEAAMAKWPEMAPRIDHIAALARQMAARQPDLTAVATAIAAEMERVEAERRARRRRRDLVAILLLAA